MVALARTTVIRIGDGTTMADITNGGDMPIAEPSSDKIDTADKNCITRLDGAVDARGTTQSKTVSANLIADTEICLRVEAAEVGGLFNSAIAEPMPPPGPRMSALGQKQTCAALKVMSALCQKQTCPFLFNHFVGRANFWHLLQLDCRAGRATRGEFSGVDP